MNSAVLQLLDTTLTLRPGTPLVMGVVNDSPRPSPRYPRLVATGHLVSVDTWKAPVARAALDAGAHLVNDVERSSRRPPPSRSPSP